jgi:hypothetical protein
VFMHEQLSQMMRSALLIGTVVALVHPTVYAGQPLLPEVAVTTSDLLAGGWEVFPEMPKDLFGVVPLFADLKPSSADQTGLVVRVYDLCESASATFERDFEVPIKETGSITFNAERLSTAGQGVQSAIRFRIGNQGLSVNSLENSAMSLALRSDGDLTVEAGGSPAFVNIRGGISSSPLAITVVFNAGKQVAEVAAAGAGTSPIKLNSHSFVLILDGLIPFETPEGGFPFQVVKGFNPEAGIGRVGFVSASAASGGDIAVWDLQLKDAP